ncbi:MAG: sigma 54-interacting transcriptional regulator [Deltaproteobacteria bacterium]|nr:sigma 54-interacting transcriptional regulator [Deltaproteobacteria bacterium]
MLDELVQGPLVFGTAFVSVDREAFPALGRHLARRCEQTGRRAIVAAAAPVADVWQQLASRLGVLESADQPEPRIDGIDVAAKLAQATMGSVVVVAEHRPTAWGRTIRQQLARLAADAQNRILLVVMSPPATTGGALGTQPVADSSTRPGAGHPGFGDERRLDDPTRPVALSIELPGLTPAECRRWWAAVVAQDDFVSQPRFGRLAALDQWWQSARERPVAEQARMPRLKGSPGKLLEYARAAEQALTAAQAEALVSAEARQTLIERGLVTCDETGAITAQDCAAGTALSTAQRRRLAAVLAGGATGRQRAATPTRVDPWSLIRACEIYAELGHPARAERHAHEALRGLGDSVARQDLWLRWEIAVERLTEQEGAARDDADALRLERLLRSAELALELGDCDRADALVRQGMTIDAERFDVLLLHGRASTARGDVTTAALSVSRALSAAPTTADRARAAGLMATVCQAGGDPEQAARYALEAVELSADAATRLEGRNVLGKLVLAREAWAEAERHFAADAYEAALAGEREAELRARLNRAIAVLYLGRRDRARTMLEEVMVDGERYSVPRAVAFALSNLAAIAIVQHQYERALALSEQAIEVRRRIGGRLGMVQPITNLAELRLQLGLVDEAEQGLRFGLQACGQDLPPSRYAYFAKASACVHLARGETGAAANKIATAISGATSSGDRAVLAQCHRLNARLALEDGDLARARTALDQAATLRHTTFGEAELAVLEAMYARASGGPLDDVAREALTLAQRADDPESLRDAHVLLHHAQLLAGDLAAGQSHLRRALAERDRVAAALPGSVRGRYLARRELAELYELEANAATVGGVGMAGAGTGKGRANRRAASTQVETSAVRPIRRMVGDSPPMRALRGTIKRVAPTDATVLITGETGTGKELVAEAVHRASARRNGPLVKVNCAALVETLLLSELFGHEKGAFTGASARRRGRFEVAEGGTLFLDEIGDISARTQVALLRVLQDGTFERVGGCTQLHANVRIVCATHRDLKAMVERGEFREDLYYRLCGVALEVPPLCDRLGDLPRLAEALLVEANRTSGIDQKPLSRAALQALSRHRWPGNVRELENALRVAALFAAGPKIELTDFTENVEGLRHLGEAPALTGAAGSAPTEPRASGSGNDTIPPPSSSTDIVYAEIRGGTKLADMKRRLEQECIARALVESGGNITRAADLLGMKRPRLSQLVKQYELAKVLEDLKS